MALFLATKALTLTHRCCYRDTYPVGDEESRRQRVFYLESTQRRTAGLVLLAIVFTIGSLLTFILMFTFVGQAKDDKLSPTSSTFKMRIVLAFLPIALSFSLFAIGTFEYFVYRHMYNRKSGERENRELQNRITELDMLDASDFVVIPSNTNSKGKTPAIPPVPDE